MQLLERESSLASLAGYAQEARRGEGRLVLVAGEAGIGKSALVEQLERDLPEARWSWGACDGLFTPRPLGPLFDLAAQLGGELLDLCRARAGREELFAALLRQVSEPGTLDVVVVEDIHWADEATVDMLRFVGRRIKNAGVLLIASYRKRIWPRGTCCGRRLVSLPGSAPPGGSSCPRCRPARCGSWRARPGWTRPSCTG